MFKNKCLERFLSDFDSNTAYQIHVRPCAQQCKNP